MQFLTWLCACRPWMRRFALRKNTAGITLATVQGAAGLVGAPHQRTIKRPNTDAACGNLGHDGIGTRVVPL